MLRRFAGLSFAAILLAANLPLSSATAAAGITSLQRDELTYSYRQLVNQFYKPVEAQHVLDGARTGMIAVLSKSGVKNAAIPSLHAGTDAQANERALTASITAAVTKYGAKTNARDLTYGAITGMLQSVDDRYTQFLSPKEYSDLNSGLDGAMFGGVGLSIGLDDATKQLKVQSVIEGGPAEAAGVQADDMVTTINATPTKGMTLDNDSKMLRGVPGTTVKLSILRDGKPIAPITVTRAEIKAPSVTSRVLDGQIGYVRLSVFGATTSDELGAALKKLEAAGAKAYILDLRDNGGGYLNAAIDVSSKFIATGPIVSVAERQGSTREYDADDVAIAPKPLAVLVNKYTASASEITSGAIQDDGIGTLIGEKTFGKGVVQTIFPLPDGAAVKITTARYLTPAGRDINKIGIVPDMVVVEQKGARFGQIGKDAQLESAIGLLKGKIAANAGT